jgi:hypothetical protein
MNECPASSDHFFLDVQGADETTGDDALLVFLALMLASHHLPTYDCRKSAHRFLSTLPGRAVLVLALLTLLEGVDVREPEVLAVDVQVVTVVHGCSASDGLSRRGACCNQPTCSDEAQICFDHDAILSGRNVAGRRIEVGEQAAILAEFVSSYPSFLVVINCN